MYLLPLLTLLGSAFCVAVVSGDDRAERYLLPGNIIPTFYDVKLFFNPSNSANFTGEVTIRVVAAARTNVIVLHAQEMEIATGAITVVHDTQLGTNLVANFTLATDDTQLLRIFLNRELQDEEPVRINIRYLSRYAANMFGVYVSSYDFNRTTQYLVTSQLQPTYARRAFPCFDEPALKAIFRTTIYAPPSYTVVRTNMPLRPSNDLEKPDVAGWAKHEFQDTPIMSTYLHGFLVSNFDYIGNRNPGNDDIFRVPFNIYSRPATQNSATFALDFGQKSMYHLEAYYGFKYDLPKLDKVAVPDFAAGAMENWGLCIYREVALLVSDGVTTTATKQNVARIITHENVHLWIGNEVTPISWKYLWLSEGLATFFDHYGNDFVEPTWRMSDQFLLGVQNVFQSDAVLSVNPMTHPVYTPSEILGTFNAVAYQKSGSVMRMLQHILTPSVFRQGLINYIQAMSRKAAAPADLYFHFQRALNASDHTLPHTLQTILEPWVNQGGFPVVTVIRNAGTANSVTVSQVRYLTNRALTSNDRWYVPLNWITSAAGNFSDTKPMAWLTPGSALAIDIPQLSDAEWFIFNKQQTGYYRVNYDVGNWKALNSCLTRNHDDINVLNRANILDDAFNLARNGRLNYTYALDLSRYLINETDYIPWGAVNPSLTYLDSMLGGTEVYSNFQNYLRNITQPLYNRLGFNVTTGEDYLLPFLRNIILDLNCRHGNDHCIGRAETLLSNFRTDGSQRINPDIQTLVYCSSVRGGSAENWNYLWNMYRQSTDSSQQSILLNALGCTSNRENREFYLHRVIASSSEVRDQDRHTIIVAVINSSPEGTADALDFVINYFDRIQPNVQGLTGTTNILNALSRRLTNETHSEQIDRFVSRYAGRLTAGETASVAAIRENIAASIAWNAQNAATVEAWLKENYSNSAAALTSSLILLITVFVTVFNR